MRTFKSNIYISNPEELTTIIKESYSRQTVIVMSIQSSKRYGLDSLLKELEEAQNIVWISSFSSNPTQQDIQNSLIQIGSFYFQQILAIGGGSAIDLSKGILALYPENTPTAMPVPTIEEITKAITEKSYTSKTTSLSLIAIPTTAGTGSEVTSWATIWDVNASAKYSIDAPWLTPKTVYLIPELTYTLSPKLTLSTGLDALAHAMEAYWAKATNSTVKTLSLDAVQAIVKYLPIAVADPSNNEAREQLLLASCTSGLAFSQTRTTACHSISYPLTYLYHVEHGFAVAMTLAQVAKINKKVVPDLERLLDCFSSYNGIDAWMNTVCNGIVTLRLANWDISEADIPTIVQHSFTKGRMDNNPVALTPEDVTCILKYVL